MKGKSITTSVLFPIVIFISILSLTTFVLSGKLVKLLIDEYNKTLLNHERVKVVEIIDQSPSIKYALSSLKNLFSNEKYVYLIKQNNQVLLKHDNFPQRYEVKNDGFITAYIRGDKYKGFSIFSDKYDISVIALMDLKGLFTIKRKLNTLLSIFSLSVLLIILFIIIILRKNMIIPLKGIMEKVKKGECAVPTGIHEVDSLVEAINDAIATAELKGFQMKALHKIAVAINEGLTLDDIMDTILEQSKLLIDAELSAIAIYDEHGKFKKLRVTGVERSTIRQLRRLPEGKGILKLMQLTLHPVRINDVSTHEAFSGQFPEGHPVIKNFLGYPIFSSSGKPLGALYFANKQSGDFTEEDEEILKAIASDSAVAIQRAEEIEALEEFKRIIENSFDAIVITNRDGVILYVNRAFEEITGYTRKEAIGRKPNILKSGFHEPEFYRDLWKTILSKKPWKGEFINKRKDGTLFTTSTVIFPLFDDSGEISQFVSIQRDITEEKKLYEQLLRAQKMEAIGTLAGGIAHDFNNILTAILGYAEILKDAVKDKGEKVIKAVDIIERSAQKGADLANKILNITRKEKLELKVADLNTIVREAIELIKRSIPKDIEIKVTLTKNLPPIKADPSQLHQVIMNLAINARDAMPNGGILHIKTEKVGRENGAANGLKSDNGFVKLSVSDTGIGIDKDMQSKIFDPFFTTKEKGRGTGLGLYIVHSIITNHGGYINLYSEPNKGTRFSVYLPVAKGRAQTEEELRPEQLEGNAHILVVDDEKEITDLVKDLLEPLGYRVTIANDGVEALEIFREKKDEIDLVILDMIMPKLNGAEVFQRLKNIEKNVKIIIASGYTDDGLSGIRELMKSGAKGFVQKPFTRKTLAKAIKEALKEEAK